MEINPPTELTPDQVTGDQDRAKEVLGEIQAVLRRYGCTLQFEPLVSLSSKPEIILAWVTDPEMKGARRLAAIEYMTPFWVEAKVISPSGERTRLKDGKL